MKKTNDHDRKKDSTPENEAVNDKDIKDVNKEEKADTGSTKTKKRYTGILTVIAIAFIVLYCIVNISSLSSFSSGVISVFAPIILGFAFAYLLEPVLKLFEYKIFKRIRNKNVLRGLSILMTYVCAAVFFVALIFLIVPELVDSVSNFGVNFNKNIDNTINLINGAIADYFGTHEVPEVISKEKLLEAVSMLLTESGDLFQSIGSYVIEYGKGLVIGIKNVVLAVFISIYVLISKEKLFAQGNKICTALLSEDNKEKLYKYIRVCDKTFSGFFVGKIIDSLIIGVITLIALLIFDIPYAILVAAIVCVTNVIPVFGPFIGAIPSFFIIFIVNPTKALIFLVLIILIQQLDGNVIGPKILGNTTGMSSLGVIISIIVMGEYFGVIGMIVGVPIFAVALTLINEVVENKLRKKNLPVNSAEYYSEDSLVDPHEEHKRLSEKLFSLAGELFGKLMNTFRKKKKKQSEDTTEKNTESENNENEQ